MNCTKCDTEDSFRQGWKEAMAGETRPVSELWDGIDAEFNTITNILLSVLIIQCGIYLLI